MKINKQISHNNDQDLREVIAIFWKEKILILCSILVFMIIGSVYGMLQPKTYKTEITIRKAPEVLFEIYKDMLFQSNNINFSQSNNINFDKQFNDEFEFQLLSIDSLVEFVNQSNDLEYLKSYLIQEKIDLKKYFIGKFQKVKEEKNFKNKYFFLFSKPFTENLEFTNNYVIFVKQKVEKIFKQQIFFAISNKIEILKSNLVIAQKLNIQEPFMNKDANSSFIYLQGTKVLSEKLSFFERMINENKNINLKYDPILTKASSPKDISTTWYSYLLFGFIFGFSLSLLIIFFKRNY